jgi:hypothetical protein
VGEILITHVFVGWGLNAQALLRRGTARAMQAMFVEAMADFEAVLVLEPTNKAAKQEKIRLKKMVADGSRRSPLFGYSEE